MTSPWVRRRPHQRRSKSGRTTFVRGSWVFIPTRGQKARSSYRHPCPKCGAGIVSVRMKQGGWAHFEGARGLGTVKHPCLHQGEGLSCRREEDMDDLFGTEPIAAIKAKHPLFIRKLPRFSVSGRMVLVAPALRRITLPPRVP